MEDQRVGRVLRALRHRLDWRQEDVGRKARVSQDVVSRVELGRISAVGVSTLRRIAAALGAELVITIRWRGGEIDRLLDEGHASLASGVVSLLTELGWEVQPEVSYSVWGERGSVDLLAWHAPTRTLLVIEVKTELTSLEETLRKIDAKVRLAPDLAADRFGWRPTSRGHLLVLPAATTPRRHVARHSAVLGRVFPLRAVAVRRWLAAPTGPMGGLLFMPLTPGVRRRSTSVSRKRIRVRPTALPKRPSGLPEDSGNTNHASVV